MLARPGVPRSGCMQQPEALSQDLTGLVNVVQNELTQTPALLHPHITDCFPKFCP